MIAIRKVQNIMSCNYNFVLLLLTFWFKVQHVYIQNSFLGRLICCAERLIVISTIFHGSEHVFLILMLTNQEMSVNIFCVPVRDCICDVYMFCVWFTRCVRHTHGTCMFPLQRVSLSLWGVPSSEAKDAFLYSHTSTRRKRYLINYNNMHTREYNLFYRAGKRRLCIHCIHLSY